ncbi:calcium-binding protein [Sphingopyxis panaciterrae]
MTLDGVGGDRMGIEVWQHDQGIGPAGGFPETLLLANGNIMVVWSGGGINGLQYNIIDPLGQRIGGGAINPGASNPQIIYGLTADANGGFTLLYSETDSSGTELMIQHFNAAAQATGPALEVADDIQVLTNRPAEFVELADGGYAVAYTASDPADIQDIALRFVSTSGSVGDPVVVNTTTAGRQFDPRIASNGDNLFLSWRDEATGDVRGQMLSLTGQPIGSEFLIPSSEEGTARNPRIEVFASGNYIVVWDTENGAGADSDSGSARARLFDPDGNPIGTEFVLNDETEQFQGAPTALILADDSFVVSYYDYSDYVSAISFRWFNADGTPRSDSILVAAIPAGQNSLRSFGDGRFAAFGIDSFLSYMILDTREGHLNGNDGDNILVSERDGDSTIYGFGGNDRFFGNDNNQTFVGGAGNDEFRGALGEDRFYGGAGDDSYYLTAFSNSSPHRTLYFENAGEGTDTVYTHGYHYLFANVENGVIVEDAGTGWLVGNASDNVLTGNDSENMLLGGAGNDTLYGGGSQEGHPDHARDSLFGEGGNDTLYGEIGVDYLAGGTGDDILYGGEDSDAIYGEDGDDLLYAGASFDTDILVGGAGNDQLFGNSGLNEYDLMDGGAGNDIYFVDTVHDLTFEAENGGTDTVIAEVNVPNAGVYLYANVENLELRGTTSFGVGNTLDNRLTGSASANWLLGGAGNDILNGKGGNDVLFGEAGGDFFAFQRGTGGDVIGDFLSGTDKINVSAFGFASFEALQASFSQAGTDGAIVLGNGDFIVLQGVTMSLLTAGDFIL